MKVFSTFYTNIYVVLAIFLATGKGRADYVYDNNVCLQEFEYRLVKIGFNTGC